MPGALRMTSLDCAGRVLSLARPVVMGVLNVTPDSFSDGGRYQRPAAALAAAERMAGEGAAIIDIGGESTRPGAAPVSTEEELQRVLPVVECVAARVDAVVCVDTSNPEVMRRAHGAGAQMINDVRALRVDGALQVMAASRMALCLMHMRGEPATMQRQPRYDDVVAEVRDYLAARVQVCVAGGIEPGRLCVDPGFGFGKALEHNLLLLRRLRELQPLGLPVAVGLSRKSMAAALVGADRPSAPGERLAASLALAAVAVLHGALIVRAHDVAATVDAVRVAAAIAGPR
jgi:dihydropteroate synthase